MKAKPKQKKEQTNSSQKSHTTNEEPHPPLNSPPSSSLKVYFLRKTIKYVIISLAVYFGQLTISVSLKRYGIIERDFNEIVADNFLVHVQNQTSLYMPQLHESLYWFRTINQSFPSMSQSVPRPGYHLSQQGAKAKYPIVMIPGFVTSGLEVWQGRECAKQLFRQRIWGGVGMVQHWLMERHCIVEHMALDPVTGKDPEGIRVRAAQGFESADYFAGNYWVWGKLLENLADIGYDGSMMSMEPYDWRLAFPKLEERDGYLTKLKYKIEAFHKASGQKVVLTSHSLGGILVHYFFAWVVTSEKDGGGGGGKDWVDKHIHAYINIAGAHLGVPKAISALLSGEMSDTVVPGPAEMLLEQFLGRKLRKDLFSTWGGLWAMIPKGGDALWGAGADFYRKDNASGIDDSCINEFDEHLLIFTGEGTEDMTCEANEIIDASHESTVISALIEFSSRKRHTLDEIIDFLTKWGGGSGPTVAAAKLHSFDPKAKPSHATWHDITRTPLPHAPNLKIYCLYGVGVDTERGYYYKRNTEDTGYERISASFSTGIDGSAGRKNRMIDPPFILDTSVEDPLNDVSYGIKYADGDGSVPLLSLGYMCADGWRRGETGLNPGKTKVVTREYKHRQEMDMGDPMRGGPFSADHVDIMGNLDMMRDFLRIVSDHESDLQDDIVSDIKGIAERIKKHPKGGLRRYSH